MEKLYSCLKMAGGGDTSPLDSPLPTPITVSLTTPPTSRFGFIMMCGKLCHSCFEITARTTLAQFGHFALKTRVRLRKGGSTPKILQGCATGLVTARWRCSAAAVYRQLVIMKIIYCATVSNLMKIICYF